jgi:sec-independent protein translocase protein TatC
MQKFAQLLWSILTFPGRAIFWLVWLPFRMLGRIHGFLNHVPEENHLAEVFSASVQKPSLVLGHFESLRKHLLRILIALILSVTGMFFLTPQMVDFLSQAIGGMDELVAIDVTESVGVFMRVAVMCALAIASPYIAFELWLFAAPGLTPREKKIGLFGIPLVLIFFAGGILFSYTLLLPTALPFLLNFMGVEAMPRISSYINFVTGILFWMGIAFETPLVIFILSALGIIQPATLAKQWRIAFVIIAIAAAAITPTPDPVNMSIVMAPLVILYLISIGFSFIAAAGRKRSRSVSLANQ